MSFLMQISNWVLGVCENDSENLNHRIAWCREKSTWPERRSLGSSSTSVIQKSWVLVSSSMKQREVIDPSSLSVYDYKEIQPVHPKGDQSWVFIGRTDAETETPILRLPHEKSWLIGKDPDAGRDWRQKGTTEDEMAGWHHWLNGHEFE